jgi:hypothetical protein
MCYTTRCAHQRTSTAEPPRMVRLHCCSLSRDAVPTRCTQRRGTVMTGAKTATTRQGYPTRAAAAAMLWLGLAHPEPSWAAPPCTFSSLRASFLSPGSESRYEAALRLAEQAAWCYRARHSAQGLAIWTELRSSRYPLTSLSSLQSTALAKPSAGAWKSPRPLSSLATLSPGPPPFRAPRPAP